MEVNGAMHYPYNNGGVFFIGLLPSCNHHAGALGYSDALFHYFFLGKGIDCCKLDYEGVAYIASLFSLQLGNESSRCCGCGGFPSFQGGFSPRCGAKSGGAIGAFRKREEQGSK